MKKLTTIGAEAVSQRYSVKMVFLEISQNSQEISCNFIKKEALAQVLPCEFCEISKNPFFTEQLRTTVSASNLRFKIYAREMLVEVSWMCDWKRSVIFLEFYVYHTIWNVVTVNLLHYSSRLLLDHNSLWCGERLWLKNIFALPRSISVKFSLKRSFLTFINCWQSFLWLKLTI